MFDLEQWDCLLCRGWGGVWLLLEVLRLLNRRRGPQFKVASVSVDVGKMMVRLIDG